MKVSPVPYTHLTALVYENAVYLTLVGTWKGGAPVMKDIPITYLEDKTFSSVRVDERLASSGSRLVLDVPQGVQVKLVILYLLLMCIYCYCVFIAIVYL